MPKITAKTLAEHRSETADRLLDAFGELIMSKGYDAVSLAEVAHSAGLARTAIYNYFPDRESLLIAWTDREVGRTMLVLRETLDAAPKSTDKLRAFVRFQLESFATRHLPPGREAAQFLGPESYTRFMHHIEPLEELLQEIIAEGIATKEFAGLDPASTVPMVLACIGAERVPIAQGIHDFEEATERVTTFLLRALGVTDENAGRQGGSRNRRQSRAG